jgi:hypothetical protein
MAQVAPTPMCPMVETCNGIMERPLSGLVMIIPAVVLIALGVSNLIWPSVLPWLVAIACILAGGAILLMVNFMRRVGARLRRAGD